jgi:hypothetical protein
MKTLQQKTHNRSSIRWTVALLALLALGFYAGFFLIMSVR